MQDFLQINIGHLLTIGVLIVTVAINFTMLRSTVDNLAKRIVPIEVELAKLREVVVSLARQEERLNAMDQRMLAQGKRFDDLYAMVFPRFLKE